VARYWLAPRSEAVTSDLARGLAAEAAGTALLVAIGTGAIVAGSRVGGIPQWELAVAWFVAVSTPVFLFSSISGAHLNPVVTVALFLANRFPWRQVAPHVVAQVAGAFAGSAVVLLTFGDVAHLGATVPQGGAVARALVSEFAFTLALVLTVFVLVEFGVGLLRWRLLLPGAVVAVSTYWIGPWTGSSLNPARSLAPAVLSGTYTDLWVYLVAPPLAAVVAGIAFRTALWPVGRLGSTTPD
jgi:MIP family channel proteins